MKKLALVLVLGTLTSVSSFAQPPFSLSDCKNPIQSDSALLRAFGLSTGMSSCGLGTTSEGMETSGDLSSSSSGQEQKKEFLAQAIQGSLRIQAANSEEEQQEILRNDANLEAAYSYMKKNGYKGSLLDFANRVTQEFNNL